MTRRSKRYEYLLGYSPNEAARLRAQARLWDPVSHQLFDRLDVRRGSRVLEIGPGQGSLHMELRRRVRGPVDAVERSPLFARRLKTLTRRDGFGDGTIWQTDLIEAPLPASTYDLIFARWVFLFLPETRAHIRKLARALKPGGRLAIQDYHRDTFTLIPQPPEWSDLMAADRAFFASQGGHSSIGPLLPAYYTSAGLDVLDVHITTMCGHPGSTVWTWLTTYFMGVLDRLAEFPPLSTASAQRLRHAWKAAGYNRSSLLVGPAVLDIVGRKRSRSR